MVREACGLTCKSCRYGLRLIVPLTDWWNYYHGGSLTFLRWRNLSTADQSAFYSNADVITDFKQYIGTIVNRTNTYNNVSIKSRSFTMSLLNDYPDIVCE